MQLQSTPVKTKLKLFKSNFRIALYITENKKFHFAHVWSLQLILVVMTGVLLAKCN